MKRFAFIYNPGARAGRSDKELEGLKNHIEADPGSELFVSKRKGDIPGLVRKSAGDFDVFVACGGDGTVQEVGRELVFTDKILGIIPLGTGNDLCKTLKIPRQPLRALELVKRGKATRIDAGCCNGRVFLNSLGFGFDGLTNRYAGEFSNLPGFLRYSVAALGAIFTHQPFRVKIKKAGGAERKDLIMLSVANGRVEGGSFWIAPGASISDGKLNLLTIRPISKPLIPLLLPLILFKKPQWISHLGSREVKSLEVVFDREPHLHADGEIVEKGERKFKIKVLPEALNVIRGQKLTL